MPVMLWLLGGVMAAYAALLAVMFVVMVPAARVVRPGDALFPHARDAVRTLPADVERGAPGLVARRRSGA